MAKSGKGLESRTDLATKDARDRNSSERNENEGEDESTK